MTPAAAAIAFREPAAPLVFLRRARLFAASLAVLQLFHLAVLSEASAGDFGCWLVVHALAQAGLALLQRSARDCTRYVALAWRPLAAFMAVTLAFKLFSRWPYVQSWLAEGLLATRQNEELGTGGWMSAFNVFFYPLAILLPFSTMPRRTYRWLFAGTILLCAIDLVALGTRNAPMFVLLFHALSTRFTLRRKHLPAIALLFAGVIGVFGYSTVNRTQESELGDFDWLVLFEFTSSAQVLKIDPDVVGPIVNEAPALLPAIFLSHYLTHSVAEFDYIIQHEDELQTGGLYYLTDQFCAIGLCDRDASLDRIEAANPRAGVYQTIWTSLLLDYGWAGAAALVVVALGWLCGLQRLHPRSMGMGSVLGTAIIALSPIENYIYNALGLVQTSAVILVYLALSHRAGGRHRASSPAFA